MRSHSTLLVSLLLVFTSACAHIDNLGNPPTDDQLLNDGTPEARQKLREEYAIAYEGGSFFKPGDGTVRTDRAPQSPSTSDNALRYLEFAPDARTSLDSGLPYFARLTASTEAGWVALGAGFGIGVLGALAYQASLTLQGADPTAAFNPGVLTTALFSGLLFGGLIGILLYLVNDLAMKPVLNGIAADSYRAAAKEFNDELERRIEQNAKPPHVASPPPAPSTMPAPVEPPPPAPVEPAPTEEAPVDDAATTEGAEAVPPTETPSEAPSEPVAPEAAGDPAEPPAPSTTTP